MGTSNLQFAKKKAYDVYLEILRGRRACSKYRQVLNNPLHYYSTHFLLRTVEKATHQFFPFLISQYFLL